MTERCLVLLQGCDDATWTFLEMTLAEHAALTKAANALNATRDGLSCKPSMQVRIGVDVDEDGGVIAGFDACRPGDRVADPVGSPNCGDRRGTAVCTRGAGHGGRHVAATGPSRRVVAVWSVGDGPQ